LPKDETCHFLAMDFDEAGWQDDITTVREVCAEFDIPVAKERSIRLSWWIGSVCSNNGGKDYLIF
jgi:hypothetical protein